MKKLFLLFCFAFVTAIVFTSCQKDDDSVEINALKQSITALQKKSDSLAAALSVTNTNVTALSKSIDSIKVQLSGIVLQISSLNSQLTQVNANIQGITAQITLLNQQYADLLIKLNQILSQLSVTPTSLSSGLVAYYPFSGNAIDSSGNGNNGSVIGATLTNDRFGNAMSAYSFNGNLISIPHSNILGFAQSSEFTVCIWAYRTGAQGVMHFIGKRSQAGLSYNWQMAFNKPGNEGLSFSGNTSFNTYGAISMIDCPSNKWTFLTGTYSNGTWKIYQDGTLLLAKVTALFASDVNCSMTIGNSGGFDPFYGKLDDVRIYNRALTQTEISYLATH